MTTDAVGGVWVYATELARALCRAGCEVTLVTMGPAPRAEQLQPCSGTPGLNVEITDLALEWMDPEGADASRARDLLLRLADRVRPDIVHLNSYREAGFDWPAPVLVVAHSCVISWWQACFGHTPNDPRWQTYAAAVGAGLAAADAWIAPTAAIRNAVAAIYRPPTRGGVIWNGIDLPLYAGPKQPFILAAGRLWDEAKNLAGLAAVAPELDWPVRVAGPTREPDGASSEPDITAVECLGSLPRAALLGVMQRASIFAAPALYEPFGLTVLEAAASGCALVLSDIPSFRELWNGSAVFVDPHDGDALLAGLQKLSRDTQLRNRLQEAASQRARRYSLRSMANAYADLYRRVDSSLSVDTEPRSVARTELHP